MEQRSWDGTYGHVPAQREPWRRLQVVLLEDPTQLTVAVHGEADVSTSDQLRAHLTAALASATRPVVIDLSGLTFCDLVGADALHDVVDDVSAKGVRVSVQGMSPLVAWLYKEFRRGTSGVRTRPPGMAVQ